MKRKKEQSKQKTYLRQQEKSKVHCVLQENNKDV